MAKQGLHNNLVGRLLAWYDTHARILPWRSRAGERADPYRVWLSEIMLQQTTVAAVQGYYADFLRRWPTVADLAAASLDDVLRAWAGLGYYARARNLHACAREITANRGGRFPQTEAELLGLPGIGPYTAAAISAIAFGRPSAAVDGNVERVLARFYAIEAPLPQAKPLIRKYAKALVPARRAGDYAQALMDLGATICTPKSPACGDCPWSEQCAAHKRGLATQLPRRSAKPAVPTRRGMVFWVQRGDGSLLLRRRPEKGLLGGMLEVPSGPWEQGRPKAVLDGAPVAAEWKRLAGPVTHTFTHFHLELAVMKARRGTGEILVAGDYRWVALHDLAGEALPSLMRKVVAKVLG